MSSILIKGMKMPGGCWWRENGQYRECPLFDCDHYCYVLRREVAINNGSHPPDCPLTPVPPHGRLIDADAAMQQGWTINRTHSASTTENVYEVRALDTLPTIIEAEDE